MNRMRAADLPVRFVVGSNDGATLRQHVSQLVTLAGVPRAGAKIGVVNFRGGLYHPKTYHLVRRDGSQSAYVGSANLSLAGVSSTHIEAGVLLDTGQGDRPEILKSVADAVDAWFEEPARPGVEVIADAADVDRLGNEGLLGEAPPPRLASTGTTGAGARSRRPRLQQVFGVAAFGTPAARGSQVHQPGATLPRVAVPQNPPYPPYILFRPAATEPTRGLDALTGSALPGGAAGLVIRLSRDSARHWQGRVGTANVSIPVPTLHTVRFGVYRRKYVRPRAEFELEMRYIGSRATRRASTSITSIMVYGFAPGEVGHGDVRMVVTAPPARELAAFVEATGHTMPMAGDFAILEWPNDDDPSFRLTLIERGSALFRDAGAMLTNAGRLGQLVGQGACWLPPGSSPPW
jgi:hypothetical protein